MENNWYYVLKLSKYVMMSKRFEEEIYAIHS